MQFSESWLRSYVDPKLSTDALAHALTMSGLEVEEISPVAPPFQGVVVARVIEVAPHPNADRLRVCKVDAGFAEPLTIVCGAPNVRADIYVPCALEGARLPPSEAGKEGFEIRPVVMRGVASAGMLCSARELGLSEDSGGLMLLPDSLQVGASLREALDLDDHTLLLKLTPNRADCLSVFGVAREVAAITQSALISPRCEPMEVTLDERLNVKIHAPDLCGRFSGRILRGLDARAPTPDWMKQRLARSGQRSISALVDISNYVMLELGRPTHVFDLEKMEGDLEVRWGRKGESLELLNGTTIELDESFGVIADARRPEALAGIMGGAFTAVTLDTTDIFLEAAFWWPESIQGRTRRLNFSTDAAHRFERGVDAASALDHLEYITRLIVDLCGTTDTRVGPIVDHVTSLPERKPVIMRVSRAMRILGIPLESARIADVFRRLGFNFTAQGDDFQVVPPSYRFDIVIEEDLVEEVARFYGFEEIPDKLPEAPQLMQAEPETRRSMHALRRMLAARDYHEMLNFSFVDAAWEGDFAGNEYPIRLLNPIASQMSVMRSSLIGSLVANLRHNLNHKIGRVRIFEIAKVFIRDVSVSDSEFSVAGHAQPTRLAGLAYGPLHEEQWGLPTRPVDFHDVRGDLEALCAPLGLRCVRATHPALHPGRSARLECAGRIAGWLGELHPRLQQKYDLPDAPVVFEIDVEILGTLPMPAFAEVAKYPVVERDLAFVVDAALDAQQMLDTVAQMRQAGEELMDLISEVVLFDQYRGKGLKDNEKSLAFRFRLQDTQQTLSDSTVERVMLRVRSEIEQRHCARLRS